MKTIVVKEYGDVNWWETLKASGIIEIIEDYWASEEGQRHLKSMEKTDGTHEELK